MRTIEALRKLDSETKAEVFLVGGFVRDLLRKKVNDDLDIVVRKLSLKNIVGYLAKHGSVKKVTIAQTNDTIKTTIVLFKSFEDDTEAQISLPRRGKRQIANMNNTLSQDVVQRDFTINSMYLPVNKLSAKSVIDPLEVKSDISSRIIKAAGDPNEKLESSPIRILRALSLSARTGYSIDKALTKAISEKAHLLEKVPAEAIRSEIEKILLSKKPSKYFRLMLKFGVLQIILPELAACYGVTQEKKYHKYDVFGHCIYACDNSDPDLVSRWAALLHDTGKTPARRIIKGRITFHKHEMASAKMTSKILKRFRYSNDFRNKIVDLVRLHMYHYTREYSDSAVRRFIRKTKMTANDIENIENFPLFRLRSAERLGNGHKHIAVTDKQKDFQNRIIAVYEESSAVDIGDLAINGDDIMGMFNIGPGEIIGKILAYLLELVVEEPKLNEKCVLLTKVTEYICKHEKKSK